MRTIVRVAAATICAAMLGSANVAGAAPSGPAVRVLPVVCQDASVTTFLYPALGKPIWDVSVSEPKAGPEFMVKRIDQEVVVDGTSIGTFTFRFGNRTGQGPTVTCTTEEHFIDQDGVAIDLYNTVQVVHLP